MADNYLLSLLGENEQIILETRQHWFILTRSILIEVFLVILTITATIILASSVSPLFIFALLIGILPLASFIRDLLIWMNSKYIVTTHRVMRISGIINKNVLDSSLEKVNDVKMSQSFWGRIFNFGDIEILTASELAVNRLPKIGNPVKFKTAMLNAKIKLDEHLSNKPSPSKENAFEIPALISQLDELRKRGIITEIEFQQKKSELLSKIK